ncbi:MAG: galactose mutarotase [Bacteroidales bacterium]|nr:galactose mutarotase [Bacteroidales bacterium]
MTETDMSSEIKTVDTSKGVATLVTLTNSVGASVTLCSIGAGIVAINVPDRNGKLADVVIGYPEPESYFYDGPCSGKVPGRYANRIANGDLVVDGKKYQLAINNGPNALHGGPEGFQNQIWETKVDGDQVTFTYRAKDGEENYPGNLVAQAIYTWTDDCELKLELKAEADAPTVINLTNHAYFNLAGESSGSVLKQLLKLNASRFLPTDETLIPSGELAPVAGTPMDFTEMHEIGRDMGADYKPLINAKGYDHCFVIDDYEPGKEKVAAVLEDPESGRVLEVVTDQPGIQVYAGNFLEGSPMGKSGRSYHDYDAVALESQDFPDAPHQPGFPSTVLRPGEEYDRTIRFKFSVK